MFLPNMQPFAVSDQNFFDVVNRGTAVSFALFNDPQLHHLVICLISRQADTILFQQCTQRQRGATSHQARVSRSINGIARCQIR